MEKIGYMHPLDVGRHLSITTERLSDEQVPVWAGEPAAPTPEVGPESEDGCDKEGFPGGCERFGHTVETCPTPEVEPVDAFLVEDTDEGFDSRYGKVRVATEDSVVKVYRHPAPSAELVKAAERLRDMFRNWSDLEPEEQTLVEDFCNALDKVKP